MTVCKLMLLTVEAVAEKLMTVRYIYDLRANSAKTL